MRIARIDQALEACENHLEFTSSFGTEIENILTRSLLVLMYTEFEQNIKSIAQEKCLAVRDPLLVAFFDWCLGRVVRSVSSSEIADLLKQFSPICKEMFKQYAEGMQQSVTFYDNIIMHRHNVAHSDGGNITFKELKRFYEEGHIVLDFFRKALLL